MKLYHYTSLAHLPHIAADGHLRGGPASDRWPADFVWATTASDGDKTAPGGGPRTTVRLTLPADAFDARPWQTAVMDGDGWLPCHVLGLVQGARTLRQSDTSGWRVTVGPVCVGLVSDICCQGPDGGWSSIGTFKDIKVIHESSVSKVFPFGEHTLRSLKVKRRLAPTKYELCSVSREAYPALHL